jgi:hypothetical protein
LNKDKELFANEKQAQLTENEEIFLEKGWA